MTYSRSTGSQDTKEIFEYIKSEKNYLKMCTEISYPDNLYDLIDLFNEENLKISEIKSSQEMRTDEQRQTLEKQINYLNKPGRHSCQSVVPGARSQQLSEIKAAMNMSESYVLHNFEKAIYQGRYLYIIPKAKREAANKIAREIFLNYIEKYKMDGLTEENCVSWIKSDTPGCISNKTFLHDLENKFNTWNLEAIVEADNGIHNEKYGCFLPPHVVAYHELMHVEETPKGASESFQKENGSEILTATKTIILLDQIYKMIEGLNIDDTVDYRLEIDIAGKKIALGEFANFYRKLENQYQNLAKAILSPESLSFLPKVNPPLMKKLEKFNETSLNARIMREKSNDEMNEYIAKHFFSNKKDDSVIPHLIFRPSIKESKEVLYVAKQAGHHDAQKVWDENWGLVVKR